MWEPQTSNHPIDGTVDGHVILWSPVDKLISENIFGIESTPGDLQALTAPISTHHSAAWGDHFFQSPVH